MNHIGRMERMSCHFDEEGIIIRRNYGTRIGRSRIKTDAGAAAGAVCHNFTRIGHKLVFRIFRCDTALDRHAFKPDIRLQTDGNFLTVQRVAFGNQYLCLYNIHIGNHFRYGMLNLYTGIDFNEIEMLFVFIN